MYRIGGVDVERWKEESIRVADELYGLSREEKQVLEKTEIDLADRGSISHGVDGEEVWYGFADPFEYKVTVFTENPAADWPETEREVFNQSGMDHELIGHVYNRMKNEDWGEPAACQTQYEMAVHRAEHDPAWERAAHRLPALLEQHKDVTVTHP